MIQPAIDYVVRELNGYFQQVLKPRPVKDLVINSIVLNQQGEIAVKEESALLVTVVNIQEEKNGVTSVGNHQRRQPLDLNLFVLIAGYFPGKLTGEAQNLLSHTLNFFYFHNTYNSQNSPDFPPRIHRMTWETYNLDFMEQSNVWSAIGAKMMPSLMYKVRLQLTPLQIDSQAPLITQRKISSEET